jgi:hypothetical protein
MEESPVWFSLSLRYDYSILAGDTRNHIKPKKPTGKTHATHIIPIQLSLWSVKQPVRPPPLRIWVRDYSPDTPLAIETEELFYQPNDHE